MADRNNIMQPADVTVRLIREGVIDADRLSRYYGYLAHRLRRLGELLAIVIVSCSLGALFTILRPLPRWVPLMALGITIAASIVTAVMRYQEKAAYSGELCRQMGRLSTNWQVLWSDVYKRNDEELCDAWRNLSQRQSAVVERAPVELPLSNGLALCSRPEAEQYWSMRHDSPSKTRSEGETQES